MYKVSGLVKNSVTSRIEDHLFLVRIWMTMVVSAENRRSRRRPGPPPWREGFRFKWQCSCVVNPYSGDGGVDVSPGTRTSCVGHMVMMTTNSFNGVISIDIGSLIISEVITFVGLRFGLLRWVVYNITVGFIKFFRVDLLSSKFLFFTVKEINSSLVVLLRPSYLFISRFCGGFLVWLRGRYLGF